ncbi:hypothetical protein M0R45_029817 [Rubus argutus]|uniref:Terpene synthase metal-binding domain-containing protein n=1 Tax=Rubus argutus TaxID=59490 RepID=A0AAW1WD35_RUBAR
MDIVFHPMYSTSSKMQMFLDDIYDAYGTFEELKIFTEAIQRWDEEMVKQGTSYRVHYAKEAIKAQARLYFAEARWLHEDYIPSMDEYMRIAIPSVGNTLLSTISLVGMGDIVTKDSFEWLAKDPKILRASNIIFRLMDDLVSSKFEKRESMLHLVLIAT